MQLFKHQTEGITFLKKKGKAILGDDMGLGKTRQAIIAAGETAEGDILIVCPASLKINWKREINMVYPEDEVFIFGMDGDTIPPNSAWHIINYDVLEKYFEKLDIHDWDTIILDESHYIKNGSKRTSFSLKLCKDAKQVYLLSGTVVQNRPIELWNQLKAIDHFLTNQHGQTSWLNFIRRYCAAFRRPNPYTGGMFWDTSGASNLDELHRKMSDAYLRRKKDEVLDMPPKIRTIIPVEISQEWRARYETAFDDYIKWLQEHPDIMAEKDMAAIFMVQHLVELGKVKEVASRAKVEVVAEGIREILETGEKVVVFTAYKETLNLLRKAIGPKWRKVELTGETSMKKRQEAVDQFQTDPKTKVFFGNIDAAGVGITLTAASKVVFADLDWNPATHDQAEDRCHRIGQNGTVNVYYYIAEDTIDEDIMEMLAKKREIITAIMEGGKVKDQGRGAATELMRKLSTRATGRAL